MNTTDAILLSQIPIAVGIFIVAYELHRLRKAIEKIASG